MTSLRTRLSAADRWRVGAAALVVAWLGAWAAGGFHDLLQPWRGDGKGRALAEGAERARAGDLAGAVSAYQRAAELAPDDAATHRALGLALAEQGDLDRAVTELERARTLAPGEDSDEALSDALRRRARARTDARDFDAAVADLRRARQVSSAGTARDLLVRALVRAGVDHREHDDLARAKTSLREATELDPDDAPAQLELGRALLADREIDAAIAAFERAFALSPGPETKAALGDGISARGEARGDAGDLKGELDDIKKSILLQLSPDPAPATPPSPWPR